MLNTCLSEHSYSCSVVSPYSFYSRSFVLGQKMAFTFNAARVDSPCLNPLPAPQGLSESGRIHLLKGCYELLHSCQDCPETATSWKPHFPIFFFSWTVRLRLGSPSSLRLLQQLIPLRNIAGSVSKGAISPPESFSDLFYTSMILGVLR